MFFSNRKKVKHICPVCGHEFVGAPDAVTDTNACRQALYRRRKLSKLVVETIRGSNVRRRP